MQPKTLTAKQVAARLDKPIGWVYKYKDALSGFQPFKGCALTFFETKIKAFEEGEIHAISNEKRLVEGKQNDQWPEENSYLSNQNRSK